jgi:hypothetical protein
MIDMRNLSPKMVIEFACQIVQHELIWVVLVILAVPTIHIFNRYLDKVTSVLHKLKGKVISFILEYKTEILIRKFIKNDRIESRIKDDILSHIKLLKEEKKIDTAMQYLFQYPSAEGFKAILDIVEKSKNPDLRHDLICNMCESVKANGWYSLK